jgi:hypothetical protein
VRIKEKNTREWGGDRGVYFDKATLEQIGDSKITYVKPERLNVKTDIVRPQIEPLMFNGSITTYNYNLTKPYGQNNYKTAYYNYDVVSGSSILGIMADIVRLLTGH